MKIQNLAVIFIIIILPIAMLLGSYTRNQVQTLSLQISYDTKLNNATYDALKAFQLNTINSDTSDLSNSKLRDIEASANTFFNSIASNFNMVGYNQDILKDYVPALVYTMYDGYYIYSPYTNTLDDTNTNLIEDASGKLEDQGSDANILDANNSNATYKQGEKISGLKPYIYYSCRYKHGSDDFVITYSLDNYITIQGQIKDQWVFDSGYLLDNIQLSGDNVSYRGVSIKESENLKECIDDTGNEYTYIKLNGVKYYYDEKDNSWFSILNGQRYPQQTFHLENTTASQYYKEAAEFKDRIINDYKLGDLRTNQAVDEDGNTTLASRFGEYEIFDFGNMRDGSIEDPDSNFNQHRLAVIRYTIEKNLSIAIANYNNYSGGIMTNFQMPNLQEDEWDKIVNNVSIISFLQGLNIGGKIYNGYSIITNNKNDEVVNEDSIYIVTNDKQYHRANDKDLIGATNIQNGFLNIDFERKTIIKNEQANYFFPKQLNGEVITGCYTSIVNQTNVEETNNLYQYMQDKGRLAEIYYTALGRERYGMYKTNHDPEQIKAKFSPNN